MIRVLLANPRARAWLGLLLLLPVVFSLIDAVLVSQIKHATGRVDPDGFRTVTDRDTQEYLYSILRLVGDTTEYHYVPTDFAPKDDQAAESQVSDSLLANSDHVELWFSSSLTAGAQVLALQVHGSAGDAGAMFVTPSYTNTGRLRASSLGNAGLFALASLACLLLSRVRKWDLDAIQYPPYLRFLKLLW